MTNHIYDFVIIGAGPAGLSLAARFIDTSINNFVLLEKDKRLSWHDGQMFPGTTLLNEFYRDLVTPVNPTSKFSFLNYKRENGSLSNFLTLGKLRPSRLDFKNYLSWVSNQISEIEFNSLVTSVSMYDGVFKITTTNQFDTSEYLSRNIAFALGSRSYVPDGFNIGNSFFHVSNFFYYKPNLDLDNQKFVVVGSGQSSCECVQYLLRTTDPKSSLTWIFRDEFPQALDTSIFARDIYTSPLYNFYSQIESPEDSKPYLRALKGADRMLLSQLGNSILSERDKGRTVRIINNATVVRNDTEYIYYRKDSSQEY